jgi:hypothetical protein
MEEKVEMGKKEPAMGKMEQGDSGQRLASGSPESVTCPLVT